jgi:hypothetical protein
MAQQVETERSLSRRLRKSLNSVTCAAALAAIVYGLYLLLELNKEDYSGPDAINEEGTISNLAPFEASFNQSCVITNNNTCNSCITTLIQFCEAGMFIAEGYDGSVYANVNDTGFGFFNTSDVNHTNYSLECRYEADVLCTDSIVIDRSYDDSFARFMSFVFILAMSLVSLCGAGALLHGVISLCCNCVEKQDSADIREPLLLDSGQP